MNFDDFFCSIPRPEKALMLQDMNALKKIFTPVNLLRAILCFVLFYLIFLLAAHFSWWILIEKARIEIKSLDARSWPKFIVAFVLFFAPLIYIFCSLLNKKFIVIQLPKLVLYMGATFFGAMWYEIILDTFFVKVSGQPGWLYKIWPMYHGYTSGVGMVMWPLYGFFIYCMNSAIETNPKFINLNNGSAKAFLFAIDAMALEILVNCFSIVFFHTYLFYYLPGDLMHFTTIQIFIPYLFACSLGAAFSWFLNSLKKNHFMIGLTFYLAGVVSLLWIG
ncbi:MAG TPA: hypothetical protein PLV50_03610 [Smithella sp.]|mgnify:CR=1 FL=1|nr:hypothetical protein [Smithella sp.]HNY49486.1 hypothetical protein [Smithella sp.]HOG89600.1 hypothetical protein [Smithella sp.]HOU50798.1 hypothetical protein [Smithella sp.]HQG65426.1 hypothetical protein [Smithella sp.]